MKLQLTFYFLLSTFYFLCAPRSSAQSEDWPQFRGPTGQGHSTERGLPLEWSESRNIGGRCRSAAEDGRRRSSPGAASGLRRRLTDAGGASLRALSFDVETGAELANAEVFRLRSANLKNAKNSHASPTPIVDGDRVYVHFGGDGTAAIDAASGAIVWKAQFPYASQHGSGGSPALYQDLLIFSADGHYEAFVVALDKRTGKVRWKTERRKPFDQAYTTPLVIRCRRSRSTRQRRRVSCGGLRSADRQRDLARQVRGRVFERAAAGVRTRPRVHRHRVSAAHADRGSPGRHRRCHRRRTSPGR